MQNISVRDYLNLDFGRAQQALAKEDLLRPQPQEKMKPPTEEEFRRFLSGI